MSVDFNSGKRADTALCDALLEKGRHMRDRAYTYQKIISELYPLSRVEAMHIQTVVIEIDVLLARIGMFREQRDELVSSDADDFISAGELTERLEELMEAFSKQLTAMLHLSRAFYSLPIDSAERYFQLAKEFPPAYAT